HHWNPHRRGGHRSHWSKNAPLLPVWKHGQPNESYRDHRRERKDKCVGVHLQ
ncbi:hypothetical protein M9458_001763, partial [Cirrhinus mrigala]